MYAYSHDPETGGLLLSDSPALISKEPRPVYSRELDLLGFHQFWEYAPRDDRPYLWAESTFYWYRGQKVAKITGGNLFERPQIILLHDEQDRPLLPQGSRLEPVDIDAMTQKNCDILAALELSTEQQIYAVYQRYKKKIDCFRVAFSGGKDSIVLLELVKQTLPAKDIVVLFGDTGMEFPDTYTAINYTEKECQKEGIAFYRAVSHLDAKDTWKIFGPPSRILRWCCSVHKAVPQALTMRHIMGTRDFKEFVFVGVRADESDARAKYGFLSKSKKIKGQVSCNAILHWSSAEIWLYIFWKNLLVNDAYRIGNQRVGCLYCPMSLKSDYIKNTAYTKEIKPFLTTALTNYEQPDLINGYWCARSNGEQLKDNKQKIHDTYTDDCYCIEVHNPTTDIDIWLKTLPQINFTYTRHSTKDGFKITIPKKFLHTEKTHISLLKKLIRKSAYCIACGLCEANCPHGCISFSNGLYIDNCKHCQLCNQLDQGCVLYSSRKYSTVRGMTQMKQSIDFFGTHAPKTSWLMDFFKNTDTFLKDNNLGPDQISRFRRFLKSAGLINASGITLFTQKISDLQWNSAIATSLIFVNIATNNQIKWYIKNLPLEVVMSRKEVYDLLQEQGYKEIASKNVVAALKRIAALPFGTVLHFCDVTCRGNTLETLCRHKPIPPDPRVLLYALYTFAEACDGYYEFTLARLMDFTIESAGVSPAEIFGLTRTETEQYLHGLAHNYPEFLAFSTTHGLDLIRLDKEKTASDVLELF